MYFELQSTLHPRRCRVTISGVHQNVEAEDGPCYPLDLVMRKVWIQALEYCTFLFIFIKKNYKCGA